ncbi:MAG: 16S rRNA (cytosine(967)-C(5))-methyltransferase RsmB [Armatimonadota bacterium]|nr:16S rRNA (cytosine(967)-C(5))-methyltransferase RsmB [Armatimonadota bacterium]MDR7439645.1 16S rRNA (cytosine(967)-C(5))-methyltransferase RsmB [Armatimonadota bacterium]MDR7563925.1 16S rRNA (cytosine(967)-C(5))-methyltransferase RsmB [Armatimonadota bacterium]MDR7566757.1 16S rRNA (cytosine(967)-C(5))-methyltransferase RsmB [Armatimonadota bacterium]MDR7601307.1 16S rRNA (cytosine(967)-C(5))-methyltransferase RsmB [Armatimonadota bacterium]
MTEAREVALHILHRVEAEGAFSNVLLTNLRARKELSGRDTELATALVLGVLRWRARLDYALRYFLEQPPEKLPPRIRIILRMGAFQLLFLERIPAYAAVHESVELARRHGHRGMAALVNAVLRRLAREGEPPPPEDPLEALAVRQSHPRWLVERWVGRWGFEEAELLCTANNRPPPAFLRVNLLRATVEEVQARLQRAGVETAPGSFPDSLRILSGPPGERIRVVQEGLAWPQDEGSMAVVYALHPRPEEVVVDACAAPGGKTTHLAALMRNEGRLLSCEVHPRKVETLRRTAERAGARCVEPVLLDARHLGERYPEVADRVLVDAPCTGLGVIRRRPEIRWRVLPDGPARAARRQRELLAGAARALRPGGVVVYAVCSPEPEEGEKVVEWGMRAAGLVPDPFEIPWRGGQLEASGGRLLLLPHRHDTDGFFIARLRREG